MRITAGYARGILLNSPKGDATRPATDAARLAVFSSLGEFVEGSKVLDIFAGTGAYGLEAASRGANKIVLVENSSQAFKVLKSNISTIAKFTKAKISPLFADCFKCTKNLNGETFDLIFADPPYALKDLESIPTRIFEKGLLKEDGLLVLEHGKDNHFEEDPHFIERRVYGSVNFSFFKAKVTKDE
jgi:16S rRNA (guanine(966)-N(2))-methyltransferase RsmD